MNSQFNAYQYLREHSEVWNDAFSDTSNHEDVSLTKLLERDCLSNNKKLSDFTKKTYSTLKIILKTKDEDGLLEHWILYHASIVGFENLVIFDHSSTSEKVKDIYKKYADKLLVITVPESTDR